MFCCPVFEVTLKESHIPSEKVTAVSLGHRENLFLCTSCRLCFSYCKLEVEVPEILRKERFGLGDERVQKLEERVSENFSVFDGERLELPKKKQSSVVYFVGCTALYSCQSYLLFPV